MEQSPVSSAKKRAGQKLANGDKIRAHRTRWIAGCFRLYFMKLSSKIESAKFKVECGSRTVNDSNSA